MVMIGVYENDNKPEHENASHDNVDDFNEDTCQVCLYDVKNIVILLRTMLWCKNCMKTIETKYAKSKDATQDKVENFNENFVGPINTQPLT